MVGGILESLELSIGKTLYEQPVEFTLLEVEETVRLPVEIQDRERLI